MEKDIFYADELDFIDNQELVEKYGINVNRQLVLLDSGELTVYDRIPGELEAVYPSMDPEKWEKISGESIPKPWPEEGLDVLSERKAGYRRLTSNEIGKLTPEKVALLYYSRPEVELLTEEKTERSDSDKAKKELKLHVIKMVRDGLITCKDDLFKDRIVNNIQTDMNWSKETVERYTQGCGIPEKKRGRPKSKNGTNTP